MRLQFMTLQFMPLQLTRLSQLPLFHSHKKTPELTGVFDLITLFQYHL